MTPSIALQFTPCASSPLDKAVDVTLILRGAVDGACSHQVAADAVGYRPDYWSRVLTAERGITVDRLGRLPQDVQIGLVTRWAEALGLRVERRRAADDDPVAQIAGLLASKRVRITLESMEDR